jgi:hypothetical protein
MVKLTDHETQALEYFRTESVDGLGRSWDTLQFLRHVHHDITGEPQAAVDIMHSLMEKSYIRQDIICGVVNVLSLEPDGRTYLTPYEIIGVDWGSSDDQQMEFPPPPLEDPGADWMKGDDLWKTMTEEDNE